MLKSVHGDLQGSYRSEKTGKSQGICMVGERSEKIFFLKSQEKLSWIMQTADICDLHLQILKIR